MKKNNQTKPTTEAAPANVAPVTEPQQEQKKQEPDFYARLLTERPNEAASIMANLNRRKDFALRQLAAKVKAGADVKDALAQAMAVAFPKHKEAHA